jgi:6,7-dimethyl-8-ribityllumazine synthase
MEHTMNQYPKQFPVVAAGAQRLAVISAGWHSDLVEREREALLDELSKQGFDTGQVDRYDVPGAFEIPLLALKLARSGRYAAIVACALVVDGGIYRHEFVASAVIDGLMRAQLDSGVPVFSAVLTPQAFHEHEAHQRFFAEHMVAKGREVARTCLATLAAHGTLMAPLAA